MAVTKKRTKAEKEKRAKLYDDITSHQMMNSFHLNGNIIQGIHENTNFGTNDLGGDIKLNLKALIASMERVSDQVNAGDLSKLEEMLVCQSYSLQNMFMYMAAKAAGTTNADHIELLSKIALKAQNQCRTTIATLAEMKNPKRATFIKQLNQANQMQVNNDSDSKNLKKNTNPANELLEQTHGERLDTRSTKETSGINQEMETVGTVNGSQNS